MNKKWLILFLTTHRIDTLFFYDNLSISFGHLSTQILHLYNFAEVVG